MRTMKALTLITLLTIGLAACNAASTPNPPSELKLENLLEASLAEEFTPGREVVVSVVELPPNTTLDRHRHPGEEFVYCLEGSAEVFIDGEPSSIGGPGTVWHVPFQTMHTATSQDEGAKVVVFRVHTAGEPVRYLEDGGTAEQ